MWKWLAARSDTELALTSLVALVAPAYLITDGQLRPVAMTAGLVFIISMIFTAKLRMAHAVHSHDYVWVKIFRAQIYPVSYAITATLLTYGVFIAWQTHWLARLAALVIVWLPLFAHYAVVRRVGKMGITSLS